METYQGFESPSHQNKIYILTILKYDINMFDINLTKIMYKYGYLIVLFSSLIEWETFIIIAGMLAHKKILNLNNIIIITIIGSILSNQILFYIGKKYSKNFLFILKNYNLKIQKYRFLFKKYPYFFIIITRFIYGFRLISPITMGITKISNVKFFLSNIIGAFIWTFFFTISGYFFGEIISTWIKDITKIIQYFLFIFLLLIIIFFLFKFIKIKFKYFK
ncbi:DedA family protein [Enterobacteriaceae endosymbiont of Donacia cincticornis]|uniref:DedA family protein n=1 Tax=Enterobacteriaceae endosymbiont of Donacia cincticornis TaxID=2675773 RepID=UPI0014569C98|nr:DedA family protein [Enterobacteriaceae endosymbiont of Donacia cincticornis]